MAVSASYTIETEFSTSESDDKCPLEGRYHKIQAGVSGELRHVAGGSIKFKGGGVIYPNGEFWKLGQAEISLSLPGGIGCSAGVETDDQRALAIVASIQATLLEAGGGFNVGSYSTWKVTCKDTRKACPCGVSKTPSTK